MMLCCAVMDSRKNGSSAFSFTGEDCSTLVK